MADQTTERTRLASSILSNPLLDEAFAMLKEGYVQALMACKPSDNENRWRYAAALRGLETVKLHLHHVLQQGHIAQIDIKGIQEDDSVFQRAVRNFF